MLHIHVIKLFTYGVWDGHKLAHNWSFTFVKTAKNKQPNNNNKKKPSLHTRTGKDHHRAVGAQREIEKCKREGWKKNTDRLSTGKMRDMAECLGSGHPFPTLKAGKYLFSGLMAWTRTETLPPDASVSSSEKPKQFHVRLTQRGWIHGKMPADWVRTSGLRGHC